MSLRKLCQVLFHLRAASVSWLRLRVSVSKIISDNKTPINTMKYPTPHLAILKARDDSLQDGRIVKQASISNLLIAPVQPTIPFLGSTQLFTRRTVKPLVPKAHRDKTNSTCNRTHHTYPSRNHFTRASELLPRYPNSVSKVPP